VWHNDPPVDLHGMASGVYLTVGACAIEHRFLPLPAALQVVNRTFFRSIHLYLSRALWRHGMMVTMQNPPRNETRKSNIPPHTTSAIHKLLLQWPRTTLQCVHRDWRLYFFFAPPPQSCSPPTTICAKSPSSGPWNITTYQWTGVHFLFVQTFDPHDLAR
jgi:hypothetical protein